MRPNRRPRVCPRGKDLNFDFRCVSMEKKGIRVILIITRHLTIDYICMKNMMNLIQIKNMKMTDSQDLSILFASSNIFPKLENLNIITEFH